MKYTGHAIVVILLLICLITPWQTIVGSFARWDQTTVLERLLLHKPTLYNWRGIFDAKINSYAPLLGTWIWNSVRISTLTALLCSLVSVTTGYAMARLNFFGKRVLFGSTMIMLMVPGLMMFIPIYMVLYRLGIGGWWGMVLSGGYSAGTAIMTRQFATGLASDVLDAARVDGCGEWSLLWHVGIPLLRPMFGMTFAGVFAGQWNNLLWANVMLKSQADWTLPQGIMMIVVQQLNNQAAARIGPLCAMGVLSMILPVALFLWMQRYVVEGMEGLIRE